MSARTSGRLRAQRRREFTEADIRHRRRQLVGSVVLAVLFGIVGSVGRGEWWVGLGPLVFVFELVLMWGPRQRRAVFGLRQ